MLIAAEMFPRLFDKPDVVFVPSSIQDPNPFQKKDSSGELTTMSVVPMERMLRTMTPNSETAAEYNTRLKDARTLSLQETIDDMVKNDTFKPIVHAELLVLRSLQRGNFTHPSNFFNSWKYIGSSKPICRLCDYYFRVHNAGFEVRQTHGNLYHNWKPPDVYGAYLFFYDLGALFLSMFLHTKSLNPVEYTQK